MAKLLVVFYSMYGHVAELARNIAKGAEEGGAEVRIRRVTETLPEEVLKKMGAWDIQQQWHPEFPVVSHDDINWANAYAFGSPTRFGNVTAQMKTFMDTWGGVWFNGSSVGKVGSAFTSSATQHGGQETTIVCGFVPFFLHLGLTIVGLPYSFQGQSGVNEIKGGSPYGATTIAGGDGSRMPTEVEKNGAHFQGKHIAGIAGKLAHHH